MSHFEEVKTTKRNSEKVVDMKFATWYDIKVVAERMAAKWTLKTEQQNVNK